MYHKLLYDYDLDKTVVIDGRNKTQDQIRSIALQVLLSEKHHVVEDNGPKSGDHGFFLAGNLIHYYNIKSVCDGIVVASLNEMTPEQTRPLAKSFLEDK